MTIISLLILILVYRWYLFYRKQNDLHSIAESQRLYLKEFYEKHFQYFNLLNSEEQDSFVLRSINIKERLKINAVDDLMVSENVKMLVSASFTQITFGYDQFHLDNFDKVFLHQSTFFSNWINRDVKGLTYAEGRIDWSWDDFIKGYMFDNDKINLALHELAHALQIEALEKKALLNNEYKAWQITAHKEIESMKLHPDQAYFRHYASTNMNEFFAVSVECFFEDAISFRQKRPLLYSALVKLLNQDIAARLELHLLSGQSLN